MIAPIPPPKEGEKPPRVPSPVFPLPPIPRFFPRFPPKTGRDFPGGVPFSPPFPPPRLKNSPPACFAPALCPGFGVLRWLPFPPSPGKPSAASTWGTPLPGSAPPPFLPPTGSRPPEKKFPRLFFFSGLLGPPPGAPHARTLPTPRGLPADRSAALIVTPKTGLFSRPPFRWAW